MMSFPKVSRRSFLHGSAIAAGAIAGARIPGMNFIGDAFADPVTAATETPAVVVVYLSGGYSSIFSTAQSLLNNPNGTFGVTSSNITKVGSSDIYVDSGSFGQLPAASLAQMAAIGVNSGISGHPSAQLAMMHTNQGVSRPLLLAQAIAQQVNDGAPLTCAAMLNKPYGAHPAIGSTSMQVISSLESVMAAYGASTSVAGAPDRSILAKGMAASTAMSKNRLNYNQSSGADLGSAYSTTVNLLNKQGLLTGFDPLAASQAYGFTKVLDDLNTGYVNFPGQFLGAELMIRAGAKVVTVVDGPHWDDHGDPNQAIARSLMADNSGSNGRGRNLTSALTAFLPRVAAIPNKNVITVILGDFARSLPNSDHASCLTATVFGKYVKQGTTGVVDQNIRLPAGTPSIDGLWSYLAALAKIGTVPTFGACPAMNAALVQG
jgi:hypothetical protein